MPRTQTRLSPAEREERRAAELKLTQDAVEQLRSTTGWQKWLRARRHFYTYSLRNQLLIALQAPHATHVAGFRAWLRLGYAVNRGEHAIRIWTPLPPTKTTLEAWRAAGSNPEQKPRTLFKLGAVFDRSQVTPLPPPAEPAPLDPPITPLEGDQLAHLHGPLQRLADEIGYHVAIEPLNGPDGVCRHHDRAIAVESSLTPNGQIVALLHELAHALVRVDCQDDDPRLDYATEELVVESVAYSVAATAGLDTTTNSIPYLTAWSQNTPITTIHAHAALIDRLARRLEHAINPDTTTTDSSGHAAAETPTQLT
jgi:N-terminal domain of anti-restriction factor ArdC